MSGVCRLAIKNSELEDNGDYTCKIEKQTEKTTASTKIVGKYFFFVSNIVERNKLEQSINKKKSQSCLAPSLA